MEDDKAPMEPFERDAESVTDFREQSRVFLSRARTYLNDGDLHQASEKGWGAAAWMTKAVAEAQGWQYSKHDQFFTVLNSARQMSGDARVRTLGNTANTLHGYYYTRKRFLVPDNIPRAWTT